MPVVELFQAHHDRKSFDCGKPSLNEFLQKQARQNADRNVGVTHVVPEAGSPRILGYYLTTSILSSFLSASFVSWVYSRRQSLIHRA